MIALFFDTETNGLKSDDKPEFNPSLVQLGAILQDLDSGRILAELNVIANLYPGVTIPKELTEKVHGITEEMTVTYGIDPKLIDITFGKMVKMADVVVAHNIEFDLDIVKDNMPLTNSVIDFKQHFCTMLSNVYIVKDPLEGRAPGYPGMTIDPSTPYHVPSLIKTYRHYFDEDFDNAHDAMADIRATRDVFLMMIANDWYHITESEFKGIMHIVPTEKYKTMLAVESAAVDA